MVIRETPQEYFQQNYYIPKWVPIIIGIALIGAFIVAIYAIHKVKT